MTITPPTVGPYPPTYPPYTNITPFTYRDGITYLEKLESFQAYINGYVIPFINEQYSTLGPDFQEQIDALTADVNAQFALLTQEFNDGQAAQDADVDQDLADLKAYVDQQIANISGGGAPANDPVVSALIRDQNSQTTAALKTYYQVKGNYQTAGTVDDAAVAALVGTSSATQAAMDGRYVEDTAVIDVAHGGTGRQNGGINNALVASGGTNTAPQQSIGAGTTGQILQSNGPNATPSFATLINDAASSTSQVYSSDKTDKQVSALINDSAQSTTKTYSSQKIQSLIGGGNLYGTYAARPAANSVAQGTMYYASDIPECYIANNNAWKVVGSGGNEVGNADYTATANTNTVAPGIAVPGFTCTFLVGERPVKLRLSTRLTNQLLNTTSYAVINLDGTVVARIENYQPTANVWNSLECEVTKRGLTPGSSHTASVYIYNQTASGIVTIAGDANNPASLQVVTV